MGEWNNLQLELACKWRNVKTPLEARPASCSEPPTQCSRGHAGGLRTLGMALGKHLLAFIRKKLAAKRCKSSAELAEVPHGRRVRFAGIVRLRQRPETASGITFLTLEDEHGMVNALVWKRVAEEQRRPFLESRLMAIDGRLERSEGVQHLIVHRMENYGEMLEGLAMGSRDFR